MKSHVGTYLCDKKGHGTESQRNIIVQELGNKTRFPFRRIFTPLSSILYFILGTYFTYFH
jgi:hypothetical protein